MLALPRRSRRGAGIRTAHGEKLCACGGPDACWFGEICGGRGARCRLRSRGRG